MEDILDRFVNLYYIQKKDAFLTSNEESMLMSQLQINSKEQLIFFLDNFIHTFDQMVYNGGINETLRGEILAKHWDEHLVTAILKIWDKRSNELKIATSSTNHVSSLLDINSSVIMPLSSSQPSPSIHPYVTYDLTIQPANQKNVENISLSFDRCRLYDFFLQLEDVQKQLDCL